MRWTRKPYQHVSYVDPEEATRDALSVVFRATGLTAQLLGEGSLVGLLVYIQLDIKIVLVVAGVSALVFSITWLERQRRLRLVRLARSLHTIAHQMRDACRDLPSALKEAEVSGDNGKYSVLWLAFTERISNEIAAYFKQLIGDPTVGCAIRCSIPSEDGEDLFVTVARSRTLETIERERHSTPIPADQGVARVLRDKNNTGVFFVKDICEMKNYPEVWYPTPTDTLPDAKRLMVAPINGYVLEGAEGEKVILGLLFITTAKKSLTVSYSDHLKSFADLLGLVFPVITHDFGRVGVTRA